MCLRRILLIAVALQAPAAAWCQDQRLKVEGIWDGRTFQIDRIKERDPSKDVRNIRVVGEVTNISRANRAIQIGPVRMRWQASQETVFSGIEVGDAVRVDAVQGGNETFSITRIEQARLDSRDSLELIGALTGFSTDDEWTDLYLAGIPAKAPRRLFSDGRLRLQRLDDRRPDNQFTTSIGSVRMTIGGEFGLKADADGDRDIDKDESDEQVDSEAQLQLEAFFEFNDGFSGFAEIKAEQSDRYDSSFDRQRSEFDIKRGELWLFVDQPLGLPVGIQIGRQNFAEDREWWWDTDLDAIRAYVSRPMFRLELAIAEEVGRETLSGDRGDAEDLDVTRLLAMASLRMSPSLSVDGFLLRQNDHSSSFDVSDIIAADHEDEDDADLVWVGARLHGNSELTGGLEADYWLDIARVSGTEVEYEFDDLGTSELIVESVTEQDRSGTGFDLGATLTWADASLFGLSEPTVTIGYAGGSGKSGSDGTFRQTGLHDNNGKFNGVDRFRYYGELTRPDLENLRVSTLSVGFRFGEDSSVELIHHNYQQDRAAVAHSLRLDADANGRATHLGDELNLIIGIEEWKHFEFEAVGAYFVPGAAFDAGDSAWSASLKLDYNF